MDCDNQTRFPAKLLTTVLDERRLFASVVMRVTYDLHDGKLVPSAQQPWIVSDEPWDSPLGAFEADLPFRKGGVDLLVAGSACTPGRQPHRQTRISVEVGRFRAAGVVFGERFWRRAQGRHGLVASEPVPFVTLPVTAESAFGGRVEFDGLVSGYPENPSGVGFYPDEDSAVNQPLPHVEDPDALIAIWSDRPNPVLFGLCPRESAPRLRSAVHLVDGRIEQVTPRLFNRAHPRMVAPSVKPGETIVLKGFSHDGPIEIEIPPSHLVATVRLGDKTVERSLTIDEVGIQVAESSVFIGYRYPFRYEFVPHQLRLCTLENREA
jgi:hypothetical protein